MRLASIKICHYFRNQGGGKLLFENCQKPTDNRLNLKQLFSTIPGAIHITICCMNKLEIRLHLTNVYGTGAVQLLKSLLPSLETQENFRVKSIYLPNRGDLNTYLSANDTTEVLIYHRKLSNALSRLFECIFNSSAFEKKSPLLVLGDLPLRVNCSQTVFLQNPHLLNPSKISLSTLKYMVSRAVFRFNLPFVDAVIVQTPVMSDLFKRTYPKFRGRVHTIAQPVPGWLLKSSIRRDRSTWSNDRKLKLIYPAAVYPHKNHSLLACIEKDSDLPIEQLILTLDAKLNPACHLEWIRCLGHLSSDGMLAAYSSIDGLLFLSNEESYGFPLVEAMHIGVPIICPDLPYARILCGTEAIYFDSNNHESLKLAIYELFFRLNKGWWPDWKKQLLEIPGSWDDVAKKFLEIATNPK
jgi:glycosyltransferase involved in cell wall biosynthesis